MATKEDIYSRLGRIKDDLGNLIKEQEAMHPMDMGLISFHLPDLEEIHDQLVAIVSYEPTDEEMKAS